MASRTPFFSRQKQESKVSALINLSIAFTNPYKFHELTWKNGSTEEMKLWDKGPYLNASSVPKRAATRPLWSPVQISLWR